MFIKNLEHRGFSGKLIFDHLNNILRIKVQTDSVAGMKKDAKALSGGEKSFSTICLLMTLWEAVGSPIRCLDEFVSPLLNFLCSTLISNLFPRMSSWSVSALCTLLRRRTDPATFTGCVEPTNLGRNDGRNGSRRQRSSIRPHHSSIRQERHIRSRSQGLQDARSSSRGVVVDGISTSISLLYFHVD